MTERSPAGPEELPGARPDPAAARAGTGGGSHRPADGEPDEAGPGLALPTSLQGAPVVVGLMVVNTAILLVLETVGSSTDLRTLLRFGAQPTPVPSGQLWRLMTAMFLHFGVLHLAVNLWALWIFGPLFEQLVGSGRFVMLYVASGLAGGAATAVLADPGTVSAGASGAIFGLLGAFVVLGWRLRDQPQGQAWLRNALLLVVLNVALGVGVEQIGLLAHLGGLAGGMIVFAAEPMAALPGVPVPEGRPRPRSRMTSAATAVAVVSLLAAALLSAPA